MDPLSSLGLAGTLVQFVSFASDLISKTIEIKESASGAAGQISSLDEVYAKLLNISSDLAAATKTQTDRLAAGHFKNTINTLSGLSEICKGNCAQLLEVVETLKASGKSNGGWASFRLALKTIWNKRKIAELEENLSRSQRTLTLQICNVLSLYHQDHSLALERLKETSASQALQQAESLRNIETTLEWIKSSSSLARSKPLEHAFTADDVALLEKEMSALALNETATRRQQVICQSLVFESQPARFNSIPLAHHQTFRWLFAQPDPFNAEFEDQARVRSEGQKLANWLQNGRGVFWVSGKPGSGKSTFMKFMVNEERARRALSKWAYPLPVVTATHFFWSPGTTMQKSQQGLLQTILHQIYRRMPSLIEHTCGRRWMSPNVGDDWTIGDMQDALQQIASRPTLNVKFCFFIDGLDEYEGDHLEFCETLTQLSKSENVKLCVSSRPWNVFEGNFGRDEASKIYIHELTYKDIHDYVHSRLSGHFRWASLDMEQSQLHALRPHGLVVEITNRAHGVFLWVFLVTKMLRDGLTNYDSASDLWRRLNSFPTELEPFFKHMLTSVEPMYHNQMAGALSIALEANTPQSPMVYHFHDLEYDDVDYVSKLTIKSSSPGEIEEIYKITTRRLNARCRGLLEVAENVVEFLHRTAADFLRTREMSDFLSSKTRPDFNAQLSLLRAHTAWMKRREFTDELKFTNFAGLGSITGPLTEILTHAAKLEASNSSFTSASFGILDELERSLVVMITTGQVNTKVAAGDPTSHMRVMFRENILKFELTRYLSNKLSQAPGYFKEFEKPAMMVVLDEDVCTQPSHRNSSPNIHHDQVLRCLLENGQDPNEVYRLRGFHMTPWITLLYRVIMFKNHINHRIDSSTNAFANGTLELFLLHGSDPNALIPEDWNLTNPKFSRAWIELVFLIMATKKPQETAIHKRVMELIFKKPESLFPKRWSFLADNRYTATIPYSEEVVHQEFFVHMGAIINPEETHSHHLQLLAELTERMFSYGQNMDWPMEEAWPVIRSTFAEFQPDLEARLRESYCAKSLKRTAEVVELSDGDEGMEVMKKKRVSCSAHEASFYRHHRHQSSHSEKPEPKDHSDSVEIIDLTDI